ncbi:MAG TPA: CHAD domain-containing protein [Solirubrobacteraceae bacterium]|nr:CHAD domain-containing protein [Solirubrobacteraceae bacterium]
MAKAAEIDADPFEPYALAAARIVRVRADELFEYADGVLDTSDIERVHDMRVASRRLRAVLEIFEPCFPQGDFKTVLRDVKALADALGERRDPDVHIEDMEELEKHVQVALRPGLEALVDRLRARQAAGNDTLAAALEHVDECRLHERLHSLADGAEELVA